MIKLKETTMRKTWVVCLLAMVCCALWGSAFPCIKVGYRLFQIDSADTATQILFAGCRFTIAGIMVILFGSILQGRFLKAGKGDLPRIGKICLLQTVVQYFLFSKRKYMNYIRGERMEGSTFWNRGITHTCDRLAVWI